MKFKVKKKTWIHGSLEPGNGDNKLLNNKGFMCCLGHCAVSCGVGPKQLANDGVFNVNAPTDFVSLEIEGKSIDKFIEIFVHLPEDDFDRQKHTVLGQDAMTINDSTTSTEEQKIANLTQLFKEWDHEIVFV